MLILYEGNNFLVVVGFCFLILWCYVLLENLLFYLVIVYCEDLKLLLEWFNVNVIYVCNVNM